MADADALPEEGSLDRPEDAGKGGAGLVKLWLMELELARKTEKKWRKRAAEVDKLRRGDVRSSPGKQFNILAANTEVLRPSLYSSTPKADVRRRFRDRDTLGKRAAITLERALNASCDLYDFDSVMEQAVLDYLLPGRAVSRVRYIPHFAEKIAARLGEFKRAKSVGVNPRHAAYLGREVSTDFAMRGDDAFVGAAYDSIIFLKAAMNSWDRLYRGLKQDPNRARIAMLTASVAMVSMALAALNYGNPLLDDTEDWDRDTSWHFFIPTTEWFSYYARTGRRHPETVEDPTRGATHYLNPKILARLPSWAQATSLCVLGSHHFWKLA